MVYRIAGGIGLTLLGLSAMGYAVVPTIATGIFLTVAGIALLAGQ